MAHAQALRAPTSCQEQLDLETVYRDYAELVKRWATRLSGPFLDVDDIVHEVFLVVHKKLAQFRGDAKLSTWLYRITEKVVYKQGRRQRVSRWLGGLAGDFAEQIPAADGCPHGEVERVQTAKLVYKALDGLTHKHRTAVILYEIEGLTGEEIADLMGTKLPTVWVWLHRGRAKFMERLKQLVPHGLV